MILPTKRLSIESSLLGVGADILRLLHEPKSISRLWDELKNLRAVLDVRGERLTFEWFVLSLDLLFLAELVRLEHGVLIRRPQ